MVEEIYLSKNSVQPINPQVASPSDNKESVLPVIKSDGNLDTNVDVAVTKPMSPELDILVTITGR